MLSFLTRSYGGGSAGTLYAWDLARGGHSQWVGHAREVSNLALGRAEDGAGLLVSGSLDRRVNLWRISEAATQPLQAATLQPVSAGFLWQTPAEGQSTGWFYSDQPARHCQGEQAERAGYVRANHRPELVRARVHDGGRYRDLMNAVRPLLAGSFGPPRLTEKPEPGQQPSTGEGNSTSAEPTR